MPSVITVGLLVIGSEILSGRVTDENSLWLAAELRRCGATLHRILTVPDSIEAIVECVKFLSATSHFVITTGGIGPTHDDVTFESIARAFDCDLEIRHEIIDVLKKLGGCTDDHSNAGFLKLASVPSKSILIYGNSDIAYPITRVENVFILPGMPSLMKKQFDVIRSSFSGPYRYYSAYRANLPENSLLHIFDVLVVNHPSVDIGVYPQESSGNAETVISFESYSKTDIQRAEAHLVKLISTETCIKQCEELLYVDEIPPKSRLKLSKL